MLSSLKRDESIASVVPPSFVSNDIAYLEHLITGMTRRCLHPTPEGASKELEKVIAAGSLLSGLEFSFYLSSINVLRPFIYRDYYLSNSIRQVFVTPPSRSINRVRRRGSSSCDALWNARGSPNNRRLDFARVTAV